MVLPAGVELRSLANVGPGSSRAADQKPGSRLGCLGRVRGLPAPGVFSLLLSSVLRPCRCWDLSQPSDLKGKPTSGSFLTSWTGGDLGLMPLNLLLPQQSPCLQTPWPSCAQLAGDLSFRSLGFKTLAQLGSSFFFICEQFHLAPYLLGGAGAVASGPRSCQALSSPTPPAAACPPPPLREAAEAQESWQAGLQRPGGAPEKAANANQKAGTAGGVHCCLACG